jgi:hypothetical protein
MTTRTLAASLLLVLAAGCGSSSTGGSGSPPPPAPALGAQIDRVGRPGVSTLVLAPFFTNTVLRDSTQDAYNAAANPSGWVASYESVITQSLSIWDGVDSTCGNQFLAEAGAPTSTTYQPLARLLADDRLYLRSDQTTCSYLGVELAAVAGGTAATCGGRRPEEDAVDITYSLFLVGSLSGVSDGVALAPGTSSTTFPFLGAPH